MFYICTVKFKTTKLPNIKTLPQVLQKTIKR